MTVTDREKELTAVGISVAAGCKPCTNFHVKAARKTGASDDEIARSMEVALSVRAVATEIMRNHALSRVGEKRGVVESAVETSERNRVTELVSIGAAFGVNCVSTLDKHMGAAATVGVSREEITQVLRLAMMIKKRAASHVERLGGVEETEERAESAEAH